MTGRQFLAIVLIAVFFVQLMTGYSWFAWSGFRKDRDPKGYWDAVWTSGALAALSVGYLAYTAL